MNRTTDVAVEGLAERVAGSRQKILTELRKVIVGQDDVVDEVLMALFCGGHCLITGVPGLAKTLLVKTIAQILDLKFKRIQFTPDLMPADITGTEVLDEEHGHRALRFVPGPIFAQIILADEINRTPPKTQAALLEAMQEYHVTAAGRTYPLERPFFVLATQNPIELEGTYPLPEAQLDRFLFNVVMTYLSEDDEVQVVTDTTSTKKAEPSRVLDGAEILAIQDCVRQVLVAEEVVRYAVRLADSTRPGRGAKLAFIDQWVKWGAGLRASHAGHRSRYGPFRLDTRIEVVDIHLCDWAGDQVPAAWECRSPRVSTVASHRSSGASEDDLPDLDCAEQVPVAGC